MPEDIGSSAFEVWPENHRAVETFISLSTQWRTGAMGATGLDYGVLPQVLRLLGVPRAEWPELFEQLQVIESEALTIMSEARQK
ncbi:DUF1799 domain-containing protein [Pseudoxanthomonas sacheonensis]|uniref:DUF1799 domain-containing protein n=1 Tax=Pseudoxanthomonas sacheonensis TaxID=443615 RepID=UPI001BA57646|nr:DUF1799 domain-containing protein [Pseudoxanthomonas sacheonensis]